MLLVFAFVAGVVCAFSQGAAQISFNKVDYFETANGKEKKRFNSDVGIKIFQFILLSRGMPQYFGHKP